MVGRRISHYKILAELGRGGMGVVYKAEDTRLERSVAIKFLPRPISDHLEDRERFKVEARAAAALNHPNIATVHAIEEVDDELFIVMEYIEGQELREVMAEKSPEAQSLRGIVDIAIQIAQGLQAAHAAGITHRDIKPANIMITRQGRVKITDFGLAKVAHSLELTKAGDTMGTAFYMSPEQTVGKPVDPRTDIWAFGIVLYEMLTGERPFKGDYEQAIIYSIMHEEPEPVAEINCEVPAALATLLEKAMRKEPEERYQTMGELLADLEASASPARAATKASKESELSIAVLPFSDLSPKKDQEYFCDGMAEELIDALAKIEGWRVVSRTSAFSFKGKEENIRTIGDQLKVNHALEGSVRKAGNRLRITAQLISIHDGFQLWSEKYDRQLDDVFAIQDDIAAIIVGKLTGLTDEKETGIVKRYTDNLEAYNLYLRARFHLNKRSEEGLRNGIAFCEQALALDENYAIAYAGLADGFILMGFQGLVAPNESMPKAKEAALKALALDENLAEAHTSLGCILAVFDRNWSDSEKTFKRAIELNPNSATAHYWYAIWCLLPQGQFEPCLEEIQKAQQLDPLSLVLNTGIGWQYYFAREYDQAQTALLQVLQMDQSFIFARDILGQVYEQQGKQAEAVVEIEKAVEASNRRTLSLSSLAHTFAASGRSEEAAAILDELSERAKKNYVSAYDIALVYTGMDDPDQSFNWLQKAFEERTGWLNFLNVEPRFDRLRSDPQFVDLVKKVGLGDNPPRCGV